MKYMIVYRNKLSNKYLFREGDIFESREEAETQVGLLSVDFEFSDDDYEFIIVEVVD